MNSIQTRSALERHHLLTAHICLTWHKLDAYPHEIDNALARGEWTGLHRGALAMLEGDDDPELRAELDLLDSIAGGGHES